MEWIVDLQSYEKTPIYRRSRDLLRDAHQVSAQMNKAYKYTLGSKLIDYAQELCEAVFIAYEERDDNEAKLREIRVIKRATQRLLVTYRIASDLHQISRPLYATQIEALVSIIKQARGWQKKLEAPTE